MRNCLVCPLVGIFALLALSGAARAQLVTPRTLPVFQDEQFDIYPTSRPGLAGVSIALDDTLADPFTNPAKATRLRGVTIIGAPYSHAVSDRKGGGRTLPIGLVASNGRWSGVALGAIQQLDRAGVAQFNAPSSKRTASNQYITASLARRTTDGLSIGASGYRASLGAMDGVDLLYAGADRIEQEGSVTDVRIGAVQEWAPGHALELVVLHNSTNMTHDVHYTDFFFNQQTRVATTTSRSEVNPDRTQIWGVHTEYTQPVGSEGWRLGALATANHLLHPKIPNYSLQNLPRDPGTTTAFNLGFGAAHIGGATTFALDVIAEPMTSDTYAEAAAPVTAAGGAQIPVGGKTVENAFIFSNSRIRVGVGHDFITESAKHGGLTLNLGLAVYSISYRLTQRNNLLNTVRKQNEGWAEWTPQLGLRYRSRELELSYAYMRNCGNESCAPMGDRVTLQGAAVSSGGIIAAPSSPLFLRSGQETSHRLTIAIPVR
ncbi:MAG: hypothetical protein H0W68_01420 [Gemmatimonadaceae bacterium]|nr:hypothetical protein [Gemmatimonadaceae bacterium]